MKVALVIAAVFGLIAFLAVIMPVRLRLTLKGRGQFGDTWVVAGGLECLGFTVTVAAAHAAQGMLQVHLFNRRLLLRRSRPIESTEQDTRPSQTMQSIMDWRATLEKRFDRDLLLRFVLGLRQHASIKSFNGHFKYCTPNVAWTGMLSGVLYAIAGLVSPVGQFVIIPEWDDYARAEGDVDMVVRLWPGKAAVAIAWFVTRNIRMLDTVEAESGVEAEAVPAKS
jgi:hypothetical protein